MSPVATPDAKPAGCWIAVASHEHVQRGVVGGFMQVCHGREGPLRRLQGGDRVVYYSPTSTFGRKDTLQAFTAIGAVLPAAPYRFDMGGGFVPWRLDVRWHPASMAPIRPLLDALDFTRGIRSWAAPLRFGLLRITAADFTRIAAAMDLAPTPESRGQALSVLA